MRAARFAGRLLLGFTVLVGVVWGGYQFWMHHRTQPPPVTRTLFVGIDYRREIRTGPRPVVLHMLTIDLATPGLRLAITPGDRNQTMPLRARTTSAYLRETGASLAINGDFFYPWWSRSPWDYYPHVGDPVTAEGRACSEGNCYTGGGDGHDEFPALFVSAKNKAFIGSKLPNGAVPYNVLSGNFLLLRDGKIVAPPGPDLQPRVAAACDKSGRYLYLLLADGRQPNYSEGLKMEEEAQILQSMGGWDALNLDGGGSTTLAVRGEDGLPALLNCPIDNHLPGRERPVANHLTFFAPPLP